MVNREKEHSEEAPKATSDNVSRSRRSNQDWRRRVFYIVEPFSKNHSASRTYDHFMVTITLISFIPLVFHDEGLWPLHLINVLCAVIFIVDYVLQFITADYRYHDHSPRSFIRHFFSPSSIIDLVVILSVTTSVNSGLRLLRVARLLQVARVFRHSRSLQIIKIVFRRAARPLSFAASLLLIYTFTVAAIMFNEEPEIFPDFLDAIYWAVTSMAAIGYGDIVPVTALGRAITVLSTLVGIIVFALPTSVITAEYVAVINEYREGKIDGHHHPRRFEVDETELIADAMSSKKSKSSQSTSESTTPEK